MSVLAEGLLDAFTMGFLLSPAVKEVAPSAIYLATNLSKFSRQIGLLKGADLINLESEVHFFH